LIEVVRMPGTEMLVAEPSLYSAPVLTNDPSSKMRTAPVIWSTRLGRS